MHVCMYVMYVCMFVCVCVCVCIFQFYVVSQLQVVHFLCIKFVSLELSRTHVQTFAKLQNFTSAIRKNKKKASGGDDEEDGEGEGGEKRGWKNAKEVAIERLQRQEEKDEEEKGEKDSKFSGVERGSEKGGAAVEFAAYNGQVLEEDSDAEDLGSDWHAGKLKFRKHITDKLRLGGDGRRVDDYKVIDSRAVKRDKKEGEGMEEEES